MSRAINIIFAGQEFVLDAVGALYWPRERVLIVSDLHFEKSTFHAAHGALIAPYDTLDTLERLENLIARYTPRELWTLGDSFHDTKAWHRLDEALRNRILGLAQRVEQCRWIEGNHDVRLEHGLPAFEVSHEREGILFTHDVADHPSPQVVGHYHPKVSVSLRGRGLRGRCFVQTEQTLVMPAFGSYTGGLDVRHEAFRPVLLGQNPQLYLMHGATIVKLPHN